MSIAEYNQPEKGAVREAVWLNAIGILTGNRLLAAIVRDDELADTLTHALAVLQPTKGERADVEREHEGWLRSFQTTLGSKKPEQLRVLYLCGPAPLNDLTEMIAHGVDPQNVWAVEGSNRDFQAAIDQLERSGTALNVHRGNLAHFLDVYPDRFDIVYYDACGPFLGKRPNTLEPILSLLTHARLEALSVLITNFAAPPEQADRYEKLLAAYFRFRHRDLPTVFWKSDLDPAECEVDSAGLEAIVHDHLEDFYSDFITRFIADLARFWIPNCRSLANQDLARTYASSGKPLKEALWRAERIPTGARSIQEWLAVVGDTVLNASGYPLLSFLRAIKRLDPPDPLASQLGNHKLGGQELERLLPVAALLDRVFEGHWDVLSEDMLRAVQRSWFDAANHFSCDAPLPNLLINALLGKYGRPYFPSPRSTMRFRYQAKRTTMFTDLITLDQCRYFFDWFPVVHMVQDRFHSKAFQIMARCILDRIGRADWSSESHPFRGAAVAAHRSISAAEFYDFAPRRSM